MTALPRLLLSCLCLTAFAANLPGQERKAPPLSTGALSGEEPLRTFGQLKQFWNKKSP